MKDLEENKESMSEFPVMKWVWRYKKGVLLLCDREWERAAHEFEGIKLSYIVEKITQQRQEAFLCTQKLDVVQWFPLRQL